MFDSKGDSGGPLLVKDSTTNAYHLIGIVSAGIGSFHSNLCLENLNKFLLIFKIGCALPKLPGLYTRVDSYIDWINYYLNVY